MPRATSQAASHGFGWKKDPVDRRDWHYDPSISPGKLPRSVDLRAHCPPVYDQKGLNSCSANATAAAVEYNLIKEKRKRVIFPSRLFLFYNSRALEHTEKSNEGVYIRDAIKSVASKGDCPESLWPYVESKYPTRPPQKCYDSALLYKVVKYYRIRRKLDHFRSCLASEYPFVFGFAAHERFLHEVRKTGHLDLPAPGEKLVGNHAVLAVGYDDETQRLIVRNSWGPKFGLKGYFSMPYTYLLKKHLTADFWTVRVIS